MRHENGSSQQEVAESQAPRGCPPDDHTETVLLRVHEAVAVITLNRPQARNALSAGMLRRLLAVIDEVQRDSAIRAVVLTGSGSAFCAGDDLHEAARSGMTGFKRVVTLLQLLTRALIHLPVPVIAAINGPALGAGFELTLGCGLRIACAEAVFGCPEVTIGLTATNGASLLLANLIGAGRATEMLITGQSYSANWALSAGLISAVVSRQELQSRALALAELVASPPGLATRLTCDLLRPSGAALSQALEQEEAACLAAWQDPSARAAVAAFRSGLGHARPRSGDRDAPSRT